MIEKLSDFGIENEVITLQYHTPNEPVKNKRTDEDIDKKIESKDFSVAKDHSLSFNGYEQTVDSFSNLDEFDIVHLHAPFLGAGWQISQFKKKHPKIPLLISYYREVRNVDFFCLLISIYNWFYLRIIIKKADAVLFFSKKRYGFEYISRSKAIDMAIGNDNPKDETGRPLTETVYKVKLDGKEPCDMAMEKLVYIYNYLYGFI